MRSLRGFTLMLGVLGFFLLNTSSVSAGECQMFRCQAGAGYSPEDVSGARTACGTVESNSSECLAACQALCRGHAHTPSTPPWECALATIACTGPAPAPDATPSPATPAAAPAPAATTGRIGRILLPDCAITSDPLTAGKCTLDDIINTGVSFANFLMGLAAAIFLAIFVWAGFQYIFFAYDSGTAGKAKTMLTSSVIAMLIILGASTIIRFIHRTATGDTCVDRYGAEYSCQPTQGMSRQQRASCKTGACQGANILCCQISSSAPAPTPTEGPGAPGFSQACFDECQARHGTNCARDCTVAPTGH